MGRHGNYQQTNTNHLLLDLKNLRRACCGYLPNAPEHAPAKALRDAIDDFAEAITGDRSYFHAKHPAARH